MNCYPLESAGNKFCIACFSCEKPLANEAGFDIRVESSTDATYRARPDCVPRRGGRPQAVAAHA